ncbi:MAG: hypothetical protein WBR29_07240 [Gammaproteobacteria bacterium]
MNIAPSTGVICSIHRWALAGLVITGFGLLTACKMTNGGNPDSPPGAGCLSPTQCSSGEALNPPDQLLGERLFKDTRFGHYFAVQSGGDVNASLGVGEPVVENEITTNPTQPLPGPMAGQAINCLQCHLVQQELNEPEGGMQAYTDFASRSPLPSRPADTVHGNFTARKAEPMVDEFNYGNTAQCLHWDCQFGDMPTLVLDTMTGRNFGWLPLEYNQAIQQVASVIRNDNGTGVLAQQFSGSLPYSTLFDCADPQIPAAYKLPQQYCLNVATASDAQIAEDVAQLISSYVNSLAFSRDSDNEFNGSPYDQFLIDNNLPRAPASGQTPQQYAAQLLLLLQTENNFQFVNNGVLKFQHDQPFVFGPRELHGLIIFLSRPVGPVITPTEVVEGGIGNCAACHAPPDFTDHLAHNTGVSQIEYDAVHGSGAFMNLQIPSLAQRDANPNAYLPVTPQHPDAQEVFRAAPVADDPQKADLGVWNIFANPDFPGRQSNLQEFLCAIDTGQLAACLTTNAQLLDRSVAVFATRTLRDLGQEGPYMHNGQFNTLADVLKFYQQASALARAGQLRNADPRMQNIALNTADLADLTAFLNSLNEDYSN